jgi:ABC-type polysaccharide/polyol phosphate transport system ATPase subunit
VSGAAPRVALDGVSKKFCRSLKRSLWYGLADLGTELAGRSAAGRALRREEFWAGRDVSAEVGRGENLGLIGPNGAGKTTLLRMLNGLIKPDSGRITVRGRMQALIALGAGFNPVLTGRENVYVNGAVLGLSRAEVGRRFDEIVAFSGLEQFIDAPVQSYSSGMIVRLGFAVAAHVEPHVLLVDEVFAVGDEGFQTRCVNKIGELRRAGTAIVMVSHDMHLVSTYATRILLLTAGAAEHFDDVSRGVQAYRRLFVTIEREVERHTSGNAGIRFEELALPERVLEPGARIAFGVRYSAAAEYSDVEIDLTIRSSNETGYHYQATNKAYGRRIDLPRGEHELHLAIDDVRVQHAVAKLDVAIWARGREELLLWWMVPIEFRGRAHSTGNSFLEATFELR